MIKSILTNLAYLFYPIRICSRTDVNKYTESDEHKRLLSIIEFFHNDKNINHYCGDLKEEFQKDLVLKSFANQSMADWQDRSIIFYLSFVEKGELYTISLYLSILIPFYTIGIKKNKIELFFSELEISEMENNKEDSRKMNDIICNIEAIVESKLQYKKFPEELLNTIIEDISFQEIPLGNLTMYNAFFNNQ